MAEYPAFGSARCSLTARQGRSMAPAAAWTATARLRLHRQADQAAVGEFQITIINLYLTGSAAAAFDDEFGADRKTAG